eukprot:TRINITY_DN7815_c0_g1_i1.p1 TRINITY_DN7815_c0_g1~~TRINITY_DN7815_c0_g1_i1.p1  ORF type:complete len:820 (+),score=149.53 TRINITY_DN7815_c0_g1_i1:69-2462(+)
MSDALNRSHASTASHRSGDGVALHSADLVESVLIARGQLRSPRSPGRSPRSPRFATPQESPRPAAAEAAGAEHAAAMPEAAELATAQGATERSRSAIPEEAQSPPAVPPPPAEQPAAGPAAPPPAQPAAQHSAAQSAPPAAAAPQRRPGALGLPPSRSYSGQRKQKAPDRPDSPSGSCVFRSATQRFRPGDVISFSGNTLVNTAARLQCGTPPRSHSPMRSGSPLPRSAEAGQATRRTASPLPRVAMLRPAPSAVREGCSTVSASPRPSSPRRSSGDARIAVLRRRHQRPTRAALEDWPPDPGCVSEVAADIVCMTAAETSVWCAERSGELTIRERDGTAFVAVERCPGASAVSAMVYVAGTLGSGKVVIGCVDGTAVALDATTGKPKAGDEPQKLHADMVTAFCLAPPGSAELLVSCGADGAVACADPHTLRLLRVARPAGATQRPAALRCVVATGAHCFGGADDGAVRKWDIAGLQELDSLRLPGAVRDLLLGGRYLWCATASSSAPLRVVDALSMAEVRSGAGDCGPCSRLAAVGGSVWAAHDDGTITTWDAQTLSLLRAMRQGAGTVSAMLPVVAVPQDVELWVAGKGALRMWRDGQYQMPVWCCDAMGALKRHLAEARGEVAALRAELSDCQREAEAAAARHKDELVGHNSLAHGVQQLAAENQRQLEEERARRRRLDAELGQLRRAVIAAHQQGGSPRHAAHFSTNDLCSFVATLARRGEASPPRAASAETSRQAQAREAELGALREAIKQRDDAERQSAVLQQKLRTLGEETMQLEAIVRQLQAGQDLAG